MDLNEKQNNKFSNYKLDQYIDDVTNDGLQKTWDFICDYVLTNGENQGFLKISNFGELYEIGLAAEDKLQKKSSGQYYTPDDIAYVMSEWLDKCEGENICDVACGTGKLILSFLDLIGKERATQLISSGKLYLYDLDKTALKICKTSIIIKYHIKDSTCIHDIYCDFLDKEIMLPNNSKVISNPPYSAIKQIKENWENTNVVKESKELYSSFMEKIFKQAKSTVIITPFSFISGNKFFSLRKLMCETGNGFVISFDNVPGNIFCGRKHGIFNSNTTNSVRAAVTVFNKNEKINGFKISPLIRFKNEERKELLNATILENALPDNLQIVNDKNRNFEKIAKELVDVFKAWKEKSKFVFGDVVSKSETSYFIDMPNTCRYYTTASHKKLNRGGSLAFYFDDEDLFCFAYCLINSSFTYWWWRIYDGGITYPIGLLNSMPVPFNLLTSDDKRFFKEICYKMISDEKKYIVTKKNAESIQENIKFPSEYRKIINKKILTILDLKLEPDVFDSIHDNKFFEDIKDN